MKFKKIDNDTSASDSQGHLTWFICVYPVADVIHDSQPEVTKVISKTLDEAVRVLGTRVANSFFATHGNVCDVSYGGLRHFAKLEESMFVIAYEIYAELSLNLHHIKEIHVIAGESGAYLALRVIDIFVKHGSQFQHDMDGFDRKWANSLASSEMYQENNSRSQLFGCLILVCPSLPSPQGLSKLFWSLVKPHFYNHTQLSPTIGKHLLVDVEVPTTQLLLVDIESSNTEKIMRSELISRLEAIFPQESSGVNNSHPPLNNT